MIYRISQLQSDPICEIPKEFVNFFFFMLLRNKIASTHDMFVSFCILNQFMLCHLRNKSYFVLDNKFSFICALFGNTCVYIYIYPLLS
jgi:hypothetical protein